MHLHQRFIPGLAIASYIVGDEKSGEAAVIDPTRDVGASIAASFLQRNGYEDVSNVVGGMSAWKAAKLLTTK